MVRRRGHRLEVVAPVGGGRVHVEIAAQVGERDQAGERPADRGIDLAAILAQLGVDPGHAERFVDPSSRVAGDPRRRPRP